jgi:hypothetical protein
MALGDGDHPGIGGPARTLRQSSVNH